MKRQCLICGEALEEKHKDKVLGIEELYLIHAQCPKCDVKCRWTEKIIFEEKIIYSPIEI